jgi:hypothetical protein
MPDGPALISALGMSALIVLGFMIPQAGQANAGQWLCVTLWWLACTILRRASVWNC